MKKKGTYEYTEYPILVAHDPEVAYGSEAGSSLRVILGTKDSKAAVLEDLSLVQLTRVGITRDTLYSVAKYMGLTLEEMASLLHTTYRNIVRKDGNEILDPLKSEKVLELAKFSQFGVQVLNSHENFKAWLRSPIISLNFKKPLEYLDTSFGIDHLTNILGRIQYGVYS